MVETRVPLHAPVAAAYAAEIERRLFYVSPAITGFRLPEHDGEIREVVVASDEPLDAERLATSITHLIDNDVRPQRLMRAKEIWRARATADSARAVYGELRAMGLVFDAGEGQVTLAEPLIGLLEFFDRALRALAVDEFGAREYRYPTLIPTAVLDRSGYFSSFPQFLMFVTRLHSDADVYRSFVERYEREGVDAGILRDCENVDYCLPPTMCFHTFHQLRDTAVTGPGGVAVTARGKSFRFESRYAVSLERLWDFTIREIVFLGSADFAVEARRRLMTAVFAWMDSLGLAGFCEVANDPFFCKTDAQDVVLSQRLLELKYELRANVTPERTVAVGSFNVHDDFFGRGFGIRGAGDEVARTSCAGFGLERLVYAFLCQYGIDRSAWPAEARQAVAGT